MDWGIILLFFYEIAYFLAIFGLLAVYAIFKGRQAIMNVIIALYFALLISIEFPYYDFVLRGLESAQGIAAMKLGFFAFITTLATVLCFRIMPDEFKENRFESMGKKLLLALTGTALVMTFSFHVLPVTEFLTPGTPLQTVFAPEQYFFWWLILPLVVLYLV
jgi:hypothetical protein